MSWIENIDQLFQFLPLASDKTLGKAVLHLYKFVKQNVIDVIL